MLKYDPEKYHTLLNVDDINQRNDPYQLFLDNIKSPETARKYKILLESFLNALPNEIYKDILGKVPRNRKSATLAEFFVNMAKKDSEFTTNVIAAFIKEKRKLVDDGKLATGTLQNQVKPVKVLLDANRIAIHWKSLYRLYPHVSKPTNDRAYTKQELQKMLAVARDITDKVIITLFSSAGFRVDAWNYFTWEDVKIFKDKDGSLKGGALRVYGNDKENYWTHFTPEAAKYLEMYKEKWLTDIGAYPKPNQPLLRAVKYPTIHRLNSVGVKKRIEKVAKTIGMRKTLPDGKTRHEVPLDHGFRKYFNTMMRRAKVNYLDKEDMMGHKVGLEQHYERYQEEDFERFPEYQKAIPFLTISDEDRLRFENQQKQQELESLEEKNKRIDDLSKRIDELEYGPEKRWSSYFTEMYKAQDSTSARILLTAFQMWFEMRATEEEKRNIWKKIQKAKDEGKLLNISEFGESKGLRWKNLYSEE